YRHTFSNGQNKKIKGERVEIFQRSVLKNTTRTLNFFKRVRATPLLRKQEVVFWFYLFRKKGKGLILFVQIFKIWRGVGRVAQGLCRHCRPLGEHVTKLVWYNVLYQN